MARVKAGRQRPEEASDNARGPEGLSRPAVAPVPQGQGTAAPLLTYAYRDRRARKVSSASCGSRVSTLLPAPTTSPTTASSRASAPPVSRLTARCSPTSRH